MKTEQNKINFYQLIKSICWAETRIWGTGFEVFAVMLDKLVKDSSTIMWNYLFTSLIDFESTDSIILTITTSIIVRMKLSVTTTGNRLSFIVTLVIWFTKGYVILSTMYESRYASKVLFDTKMMLDLSFEFTLISRLSNHEKMHVVIMTMKMLIWSPDSTYIWNL